MCALCLAEDCDISCYNQLAPSDYSEGAKFQMVTSCFVRRVIYMRTGTSVDNDMHSKNMSKKLSEERKCLIVSQK